MLFLPFTRYEKDKEGAGIGLSLVRKIIGRAGGETIVSSTVGESLEFIVFPETQSERSPKAAGEKLIHI